MDVKTRRSMQLGILCEMFRDKVEENVVYLVFDENQDEIDKTIEQLMTIAKSSFTGYYFEPDHRQTLNSSRCNIEQPSRRHSDASSEPPCSNSSSGKDGSETTKLQQDELMTEQDDDYEEYENKPTTKEKVLELQKSIMQLIEEKQTYHDKARQYLTKKMFPVTSYYSQMASEVGRKIEKKTQLIVDWMLEDSEKSDTIDLHGLNPKQACQVVQKLLNNRRDQLMIDRQGQVSLDIITGWGKHSQTNGHRVRPHIQDLLRREGYEFCTMKHNKGAIRVTLRRH